MKRTGSQISYNMSRIRCRNTSIELILASALRKAKVKYRRTCKVFGKPDFVLYPHKIAIFCDGAFWHGYRGMKTKRHHFKHNKSFWTGKISRNIKRDTEVNLYLKKSDWIVLRFWDFEIKKDIQRCIKKIHSTLRKK